MVLDLKNDADHARFVDLVRTADVFLENRGPARSTTSDWGPTSCSASFQA